MTVASAVSAATRALVIGMVCAVIDWLIVGGTNDRGAHHAGGRHRSWGGRRLEYVFKPAVLIAFVVGAFLLGGGGENRHLALWFQIALIFSLAGDVFLMLPGETWFIPGLVAFLLGHVCYIVGLNQGALPWRGIIPLALVTIVDILVLRRIVGALARSGKASLRLPVIVYGIVLSLTFVSGWTTWFRPGWTVGGRVAASLGATLFYASDLMLAWDRFVERSRLLHTLVIVTYHVGQLGLVLTIGLR